MSVTDAAPSPATTNGPGGTGRARHWTGAPADSPWIAAARDLVPRLAEHRARHDRDGSFVAEGVAALREAGFPAMLVPAELGGGGATHAEACAAIAELARGCPATALTLSMHSHLLAAQVWRHRRGLPAPVLARVAAEGLVLISTGANDWIDSSGSARRVDGGWRVSARKSPASGAPAGDVLVTSIRWDDGPEGPRVLHCSVPFAAEGVSIETTWDALGMRGTGSDTVVLDDVFVPEAAVALDRPAGAWHPIWATVVGAALPLIMAAYVGTAEEAAARVIEIARARSAGSAAEGGAGDGAGSAADADRERLLGAMGNRLTAARDAVRAMIDAADDLHFVNTVEVAAAALTRKTNAAEACLDTVRLALDAGGGTAFGRPPGIEALFRDVQGARYHPLPAAGQERFAGRVALGRDPVTGAPRTDAGA